MNTDFVIEEQYRCNNEEHGIAYVVLLIYLTIMTCLGLSFIHKVGLETKIVMNKTISSQAQYLARSAASHAMWGILNVPGFAPDGTVYYMHSLANGRYGYKIRKPTETTFATVATVGVIGENVVKQGYVPYIIASNVLTVYGNTTNPLPQYRRLIGADWSNTDDTPTGLPATITWAELEGCPIRKEIVGGVIDSNNNIKLTVWEGTGWANQHTLSTNADSNYKCFDIAYESQSGDALVVGRDGTGTPLKYNIWDGSGWVFTPTPVVAFSLSSGNVHDVVMASQPGGDEILIAVVTSNSEIQLFRWDGSAFSDLGTIETTAARNDFRVVEIVYEHQSGDAMVVWSRNADDMLKYRMWNGVALGPEGNLPDFHGNENLVIRGAADSDPASDYIVMAAIDNFYDINVAVWDGDNWIDSREIETAAATTNVQVFDVAWEAAGEDAVIAWAPWSATNVRSMAWKKGTALADCIIQEGPDLQDQGWVVDLLPISGTEKIVLLGETNSNVLRYCLWAGDNFKGDPAILIEPNVPLRDDVAFDLAEADVPRTGGTGSGSGGGNLPPTVEAGSDQTIYLPCDAILDGTVTDDGLPDPPATVTTTWSKTSGPGTVTFGDVSQVDTTAAFSEAGTYVLRLRANDDELQDFDEVTITVSWGPGWTVGDAGTIRNTTDGGATWNSQNSGTTEGLKDVVFVDADTGFVVGNPGTILKTVDGGANWNAQVSGTTETLWRVDFPNASIGYAVGQNSTLLKTTDAGANWNPLNPGISQTFRDVFFVDTSTGYVVGLAGTILKTTDGGSNWTPQTSGTTEDLLGVDFLNGLTGWVVGKGGVILKTTDGGSNWISQTSGTIEFLRRVRAVNGSIAYVVGNVGTILKTVDGGTNWNPQTSGTIDNLWDVHLLDTSKIYIGGSVGTILTTSDGGANWSPQTSGTTENLKAIYFFSPECSGCDADYIPDTKIGEFSTASYGSNDTQSTTYFPEGLTFNSVTAPAGGAWISCDPTDDLFYMTDMSGNLLTSVATATASMRGVSLVTTGLFANHLATTDSGSNTLTYVDMDGNPVAQLPLGTHGLGQVAGVGFIGTTMSETYDGHIAVVDRPTESVYVITQGNTLVTTIDVNDGTAASVQDVAHLPGTDKIIIPYLNEVRIYDLSGTLVRQYDTTTFGMGDLESVTINPNNCDHVVADKGIDMIAYLNINGGGGSDTDPPTPDPMTWESPPAPAGPTSITMTATTATDPSGVEYYFECTSGGGNDSGWQDSPTYVDTGLTPATSYTYRVKARDKSSNQNETGWSSEESATTDSAPEMFVNDIAMGFRKQGPRYYGQATVWIKDDGGADVSGALVTGDWSGAVSEMAMGTTGGDGTVFFESSDVNGGGTYTFTVTDVTKSGYLYNPALNVETSDSITVP
jgi:photosystem II stability/assembly factor-like uncharacterized protein/Tfp pilus assembly protein PilX